MAKMKWPLIICVRSKAWLLSVSRMDIPALLKAQIQIELANDFTSVGSSPCRCFRGYGPDALPQFWNAELQPIQADSLDADLESVAQLLVRHERILINHLQQFF